MTTPCEKLLAEIEGRNTDAHEIWLIAKDDASWAANRLAHERKEAIRLASMVKAQEKRLALCERIVLDLKYSNNPAWVRVNITGAVEASRAELDRIAGEGAP